MAAASQTKPQAEDLYLKKIHKMNALLHQLPGAGGWAGGPPGPCQQGVLHPAGAVRVGGISPLLARAVTVLLSRELPRKIFLWPKQKLPLPLHWRAFRVIGCDVNK